MDSQDNKMWCPIEAHKNKSKIICVEDGEDIAEEVCFVWHSYLKGNCVIIE